MNCKDYSAWVDSDNVETELFELGTKHINNITICYE